MKSRKKQIPDSVGDAHTRDLWWRHWWNESPIFELPDGTPEQSRSGAEFWYQHFWQPKKLSVWAYELVRRLAKLKKFRDPKLSKTQRNELERMPPYTDLNFEQKQILTHVFYAKLDSSESRLEKIFGTVEEAMPWQHGQPNKLGHWRQVEVLDTKYDAAQKYLRRDTNDYIKRYWALVYSA